MNNPLLRFIKSINAVQSLKTCYHLKQIKHVLPFMIVVIAFIFLITACSSNTSIIATPSPLTNIKEIRTKTPTKLSSITATAINTQIIMSQEQLPSPTIKDNPSENSSTTPTPLFPTAIPKLKPDQTSDLLFLSEGNLMRWDHITNFTNVLVESVSDFAVNNSGMLIGLIKPKKVIANGEKLFDLVLLDFNSMQLHTILKSESNLDHISISPKGNWIAYRSLSNNGNIYLISTTDNLGKKIKIGTCGQAEGNSCSELVWSKDNQKIAWSDKNGIWIAKPDKKSADLIIKSEIFIKDPEGSEIKVDVQFSNLKWSPFGRFLLTKVSSISSDIQWYAIVDTKRKNFALIPETFSHANNEINILWTTNGRILLIQNSDTSPDKTAFIKIWKPTPTRDDLLLLERTTEIPSEMLLDIAHLPKTSADFFIHWSQQLKDDKILFGVTWLDNKTAPLLLEYSVENGKITEITKIPLQSSKVIWSPDFSGILIIENNTSFLYKSFISGDILDLSSILGLDATNFYWLPPKPRSDQ